MGESGQPKLDTEHLQRLLAQNREQFMALADGIVGDRHEAEDIIPGLP